MSMTLVIGTKRYSSWSLRPWLALKQIGAPFDEIVIALRQADTRSRILEYSPAGKLPVLIDGDVTVWDSLAILEYLADRFPDAGLWPSDPAARARARSVTAEMHSGFAALRRELPMDVARALAAPGLSDEAQTDIIRVQEIWRDARGTVGHVGPFLFGGFGNADAMYAPVATRFRTYGIKLDPISDAYADVIMKLPALGEWIAAA